MAGPLNLFPQRAAIGRVDARGDVYMSEAFSRAMAQVGGRLNIDPGELAVELATFATTAGAQLAATLADLERSTAQAAELVARVAVLRAHVADLELNVASVTPPIDWEHPGRIGARTANSGRFTTINNVTITAPAGAATLVLSDGKTFTVSNTLTLAGTDGATLNIGGGGTLGSAAYANATGDWAVGKFGCNGKAAQAAATSGGTLAGVISALVANGILSS